MVLRFVLPPLFLCYLSSCLGENVEVVTVTVKGVTTIAKIDDAFVCATIDWWPPAKCNYNMCPWALSSILNLDLDNPILLNAVKAFNPLRIRIGGSLQDQVLYNVGNSIKKCHGFKNSTRGLFGFSYGCLTMKRWDKVVEFLVNSRAIVTFGLNALFGRQRSTNPNSTLRTGTWKSWNARDFIQYTISKGYMIDSWEFGNELCGNGVSARVEADQYGKDMIVLKGILNELYKNTTMQPKVLGPGGFFEQRWFADFLRASGPGIVDIVTHHIYNLGPGVDPNLFYKMQNPYLLNNTAQTYRDVEVAIQSLAPWSSSWVGESGGAYNSGGKLVSHAFVNSFWYLDQLGMASTFNHQVFCRQTLIGGNYGLLNTTTMVPNPDYYSALLFHQLMGKGVLATSHNGSTYLRAYSHCSKNKSGITLLLINLSNSTSFNVSITDDLNLYPPQTVLDATMEETQLIRQREEYHLTPKEGNLKSTILLLNGTPLELTSTGDIPPLNATLVDASSPLQIATSSIAFITFKDFKAPACA